MNRRKWAGFALAAASSFALVACGGGGGGDDVPTIDLYSAYTSVDQGMTYKQVRDIVGVDYNAGTQDYGSEVNYAWQIGKGTSKPEMLTVQFRNGAAYGKIYEAPGKEEFKYW
jgi:hypothetical protein